MSTIALFALRESLRRRVFTVVAILTAVFLVLFGVGSAIVFDEAQASFGVGALFVEDQAIVGSTLLGLAMFGTLFLGTILAVFLTLGAVRGDAERGLLGPMLVRPISRRTVLAGRYVAAAGVCGSYALVVFLCSALLVKLAGGWWPDRIVGPAVALVLAVWLLAAIALAGSVFLASTANGIAVFMVFGAGLVAGLLGQIAEALGSDSLDTVANVATWALPFEALYQDGLQGLTADTVGLTRVAVNLGPFGGAEGAGALLWPYALLYFGAVAWAAVRGFEARDL